METKERVVAIEGLIKQKSNEINALHEAIQKIRNECEHKFRRLSSHGYGLFECTECGTTDWE